MYFSSSFSPILDFSCSLYEDSSDGRHFYKNLNLEEFRINIKMGMNEQFKKCLSHIAKKARFSKIMEIIIE
jgi:hypothetical protein